MRLGTRNYYADLTARGVAIYIDGVKKAFYPWGEGGKDEVARAAAAAADTKAQNATAAAADAQQTADAAQAAAGSAYSAAEAAQTAAGDANDKANAAAQTADKCVKKVVTGSERLQTAGRALQHQDGDMWMIGESSSGAPLLNFVVGNPSETIAQIHTRTSSTLDVARLRLDRAEQRTGEGGVTEKVRMQQRIGIERPGSGTGSVPSHRGEFNVGGTLLNPDFVYSIWTIDMDSNTTFFVGVYKGTLSNQPYYLLAANVFKSSTGVMDGEGTMLAMRTLV